MPDKAADILKAAEKLFAAGRYHEVTLDEICKNAHVGKGTVYRYFHDKEDLLWRVIMSGLDELVKSVRQVAEREEDPGQGLRQVAELCLRKAHYAASEITSLAGFSLAFDAPFFKEFVVRCPKPPDKLNEHLMARNILGGCELAVWYHDLRDCMLVCVTEVNTRQQIETLVEALCQAARY